MPAEYVKPVINPFEITMKNRLRTDIKIFQLENADEVAKKLSKRMLQCARKAIKQRQAFHCVLAGGSTPKHAYQLLSKTDSDWSHWHLYLGDERVLPAEHPDRNNMMVEENWLNQLTSPMPNWYPIAAELDIENAVNAYTNTLASIKQFDLVLLGIGEDGHTASLFPTHFHPSGKSVLSVLNSPKPPAERISLSLERLIKTREIIVVVTGKSKQSAMLQWLDGINLPITKVINNAVNAKVELLIDYQACPELMQ